MFGKLLAQFQKPKNDHPLGSDESVAALIDAIPSNDPARRIEEIDHWLDDIARFRDEVPPAALLRAALALEAAAAAPRAELLENYLTPGRRDYLAESVWGVLELHCRRGTTALRECLAATLAEQDAATDKGASSRAAQRGLLLWAERKKLLRYRYRPIEAELWREAHDLLANAGRCDVLNEPVALEDDPERTCTPLQAYLVGVYLDLAPLANLVPQQLEAVHQLLLRGRSGLELLSKRAAATTHRIDLAGSGGPIPADADVPPRPLDRFLSTRRIHPALMRLGAELRGEALPDWLLATGCTPEQAKRLVMILIQHWSDPPPQRQAQRRLAADELRVVIGFALARRMVACSDFARQGRDLDYQGAEIEKLFNELHFGRVGAEAVKAKSADEEALPRIVNPFDILEKLELAGDRKMMETWRQTDASPTGIGVCPPGLRSRHRVGELVCLRFADGLEWHLAVIRRIGRDANGAPSLGLETLAWPSRCAHARPLGGGASSAWTDVVDHGGHGYVDAILVEDNADELVMPRDMFVADLELELRVGKDKMRVRLDKLLDRGDDYDRIRFISLETPATPS